jgi:hypothetical protein
MTVDLAETIEKLFFCNFTISVFVKRLEASLKPIILLFREKLAHDVSEGSLLQLLISLYEFLKTIILYPESAKGAKSILGNALVDRLIGLLENPRMVHAFRSSQAFSGTDIHQLLNELL